MEFYFSPFTKIYSRWITDLNVNGIIKFLEDNIRGNLSELRFGDDFLDIIKSKVHINIILVFFIAGLPQI